MPRAKGSVSDRIVRDVLSLPVAEAKLLVSFLATTLTLAEPAAIKRVVKKGPVPVAPSGPTPAPAAVAAPKTRKPRIARPASAEVAAGAPGPDTTMEVGD